jgi:hypothetical protein
LPALLSADLREDALHKQTATLQASAYADKVVRDLGLLLERVKHAETQGRQFQDNGGNLAPTMYKRVAAASLPHFFDGKHVVWRAAKFGADRRMCGNCAGTGEAKIVGMSDFQRGRTLEMARELMSRASRHSCDQCVIAQGLTSYCRISALAR